MLRTFWVHHKGDSCVCSFTSIGVSNLVDRTVSRTLYPTHQTAQTEACKTYYTAYTTVSLRMNPRVSKHVGDNRNSN